MVFFFLKKKKNMCGALPRASCSPKKKAIEYSSSASSFIPQSPAINITIIQSVLRHRPELPASNLPSYLLPSSGLRAFVVGWRKAGHSAVGQKKKKKKKKNTPLSFATASASVVQQHSVFSSKFSSSVLWKTNSACEWAFPP